MSTTTVSDSAKAVVRRNTEEVQSRGNFDVFDELFADDFIDHTPQPGTTPDKAGVRKLYSYLRAAFPDFRAEIHWQLCDSDRVTTYKTYHGTHEGYFLGVAPTHRKIHFETVDVMRVQNGRITDHWGVGNLLSVMQQIGGWTPPVEAPIGSHDSTVYRRVEGNASASEVVKIVRFHKVGPAEVLQLDELPLTAPARGEVRLRVKAIGLNRAETYFRQDRYFVSPKLPSKIGYEASGIVDAIGPDVESSWLGKTVSTVPAFPADKYGVYGEVAIVPVSALAEYPGHLSYEEGASIWMRYITAYGALIHEGRLARGDFVIITAASSSVGIAAIEIAKLQGATSIATTRSAAKKAELLALGADHVIVSDEEDLAERVHAITGGKGARIIFDPIGGKGLCALADAASPSGIILEYGILATDPTPYPLSVALIKHLTIKGYTLFEVVSNPDRFPEEFLKAKRYVFEHLANGEFRAIISRTFPLSDIIEAHRYMESNAQIGKIVVTV